MSTLLATIIEDLSVAIIFIPIIIITCEELEVNPAPFLLGMTICINLASTLTPFGSAQNIMISNRFNLGITDFVLSLGVFFIFTTLITLFLLDHFVLSKDIKKHWIAKCEEKDQGNSITNQKILLDEIKQDNHVMIKNLIALAIFVILLIIMSQIHVAGLIGMLIFVFINPIKDKEGKNQPQLSNYISKVDYKLIYFFICLFILVGLMELNNTIQYFEDILENLTIENIFFFNISIDNYFTFIRIFG